MDVLEPFVGGAAANGAKPRPRPPQAPAPPRGGEPVPGVEGSGLPREPQADPDPVVPSEDEATRAPGGGVRPAPGGDATPAPGGGARPAPGVIPPEDDAPADSDLPPSRS
jgi:hypothetical protein